MAYKSFTITGTHKRTGATKEFTIYAINRKEAFSQAVQRYNQDYTFNSSYRG